MALVTCNKCGLQFYGVGCPQCDYPKSASDVAATKRQWVAGLIMIAVAVMILFFFWKDSRPMAERWALLPAAAVFFLGGVSLLTMVKGRIADFLGALMFAAFSALGFFAAFGPGRVSGGIPLMPDAWNQHLGKAVFGFGGCLSAVAALWLIYRGLKPRRQGGGGAISATSRSA